MLLDLTIAVLQITPKTKGLKTLFSHSSCGSESKHGLAGSLALGLSSGSTRLTSSLTHMVVDGIQLFTGGRTEDSLVP